MTDQFMIAFAFPKHEADRQKIRDIMPGMPLTAIYKDGVDRPCPKCGITLNVGPRVAASGYTVYCPLCLVQFMRENGGSGEFGVMHLGNPDSKPEGV